MGDAAVQGAIPCQVAPDEAERAVRAMLVDGPPDPNHQKRDDQVEVDGELEPGIQIDGKVFAVERGDAVAQQHVDHGERDEPGLRAHDLGGEPGEPAAGRRP